MLTWRRLLPAALLIVTLGLTGCETTPTSQEPSAAPAPQEKASPQPQTLASVDQLAENLKTSKPNQLRNQLPVGLLANGHVVALETMTDKPNRLQIVKPSGETVQVLATAESDRHIYSAAVSHDWVVYVQASNNLIKDDWNMKAIRLDGSDTIAIDKGNTKSQEFKLVTETLIGPELSVSGNLVAWSTFEKDQNGAVQAVVRTYDLNTRENKLIESTAVHAVEDYGHPQIDGSNLVYDRGKVDVQAAGRWGTVVLRNLQTGEVKELGAGLNYASPQIQGNYVAWIAGRNDVKLYDMRTQATKTVATGTSTERWLPSLNNEMLTWYENGARSNAYLLSGQQTIAIRPNGTDGGAKVIGSLIYWISRTQPGNAVVEWLDLNHTTPSSM